MQYTLQRLLAYQNFYKSHQDYFSFVMNDINHLKDGKTIIYGIDSYDANTIVFDNNVFSTAYSGTIWHPYPV